ncbi:hypothetical protein CARUB_v10019955mg [Capsella rubella]|uniref:Uncharacterized protein n=1 Tax=Capsella rubella TaxID=81985 RepID=R0I6Q6_9BRAS|nr:uncharacterized protein LOC17895040 [Capsella rubella]XP_023644124.1 uncharacterized protein LOC17895040 [Capsella rubella]XP_023644125.1 uncharacterized protein LOC17895040 [Capsella rubella]EOA33760.1 hypothetical protein CARUB_v10019955mg [Capsella rubella]
MGPESKGRAWFSKIYNKLETLLVEVDSFTSQSTLCLKSSDLPGFKSVRGEPNEVAEGRSSSLTYNVKQHHDDHVASPRCESPSVPPSHQDFDMPGHVVVQKRVQGDILEEDLSASSFPDGEIVSTSPLLEEDCYANLTASTSTLADEEQLFTDEESQFYYDGETHSTSPLLEEYHDANLTATVGAEESKVTDKESHITYTLKSLEFSDQPKEVAEDSSSKASILQQHHDPVDSPMCKSPSDPPSHQHFDISGHVLVEEGVQGDTLKDNLAQEDGFKENSSALSDEETLSTSPSLEEYCNASLTSASTTGDEEPIITDDESRITNTLTTQTSSPGISSLFPGVVEEVRVETSLPDGGILSTATLLKAYCDASLTSTTTLGDEVPIFIDDESRITNTFIPYKFSPGNPSVSPVGESVEEVRDDSCKDVVSTKSQSTQCSMESFGTVVECNDDPVLVALGIFTDNDSSLNDSLATKITDVHVQDNVTNTRSSNADDVMNGKSDVAPLDINALYCIDFRDGPSYVDDCAMLVRTIAPLDTNALYGMESREAPSYVDESMLYAMHLRTKKLRSLKGKILDALTSKRRREKEYEQLAVWFGDADMGSDLATGEDSKQVEAMDSKSSLLLESEDSQWELL